MLAASDPAAMRAIAREYYDWRNRNDPVTSSMEFRGCQNVNLTGIQILGARGRGIALENCQVVRVATATTR